MSKKLSDEDVERIAKRVVELIGPTEINLSFPALPVNPWPFPPNYAPGYLGPYVTC